MVQLGEAASATTSLETGGAKKDSPPFVPALDSVTQWYYETAGNPDCPWHEIGPLLAVSRGATKRPAEERQR